MKRKIWLVAFALLATLCLAIGISACTNGSSENNGNTETPNPPSTHTHVFENWTIIQTPDCVNEGTTMGICACGETSSRSINALGHNTVGHAAKAATCLENGWEAYETCTRCNFTTYKEIKATGHSEVVLKKGYPATCATSGLTDEIGCSSCGEIFTGQTSTPARHVIYSLIGDTYTVTGLSAECHDAHIEVPSEYLGIAVTAIGSNTGSNIFDTSVDGFAYSYNVESIILPNSIRQINYGAFVYCISLQSVNIPASVLSIGQYAFSYTALNEIEIPDTVSYMGYYLFKGCNSLQKLITPKGTNAGQFGSSFFSVANEEVPSALKEIVFTDGTTVSERGFAGLRYVESIVLPDTLTAVGKEAFVGCINLKSISIPFVGATRGGTVNTHFGYIFGAASYLENGKCVPSSLKNVIITSEDSIKKDAFYGCTTLSNIWFLGNVASIGERAFYNCAGLTNIDIPSGVTSIRNYSFYNCYRLTNVIIPDSVTSIGSSAFSGCSGLTNITIPNGVISIGDSSFKSCYSLTSIIIPENVNSIGDYAFADCYGLTNIVIPDCVTSIGSSAFSGCSSLETISLPFVWNVANATNASSLTLFGYIFGETSYAGGIPVKQHYYGELYKTYFLPESLASVTVTGGSLPDRAFFGCSSLVEIKISDGVNSIGDSAFGYCTGLTSMVIPESVTFIGEGAFRGCSGLATLTIPFVGNRASASAASASTLFGYIFGTINYPNSVAVKQTYTNGNGATYYIPSCLKNVSITGGEIYDGAFSNCDMLTNIELPDGITVIRYQAFYNCSGLTNIDIPGGVTSIGERAFYNCAGLTNIDIPSGVTSIRNYSFYNCYRLTNVIIPDSVTSIGSSAFSGCSGLTNITIPEGVTSIGSNAFYGCSQIINITIPDGVTSIQQEAFAYCSALTTIIIPEGVSSIEASAFSGCSNLMSVAIPGSVIRIGESAFANCESLMNVVIPESVISIGRAAFSGCSGLTEITIPFVGGTASSTSASESTLFGYIFGKIDYAGGTLTSQMFGRIYNQFESYFIPTSLRKVIVTGGNLLYGAFYHCRSLTDVVIGDNVKTIGECAFYQCRGLTNIIIGTSVSSVEASAFWDCDNLETVYYNGSINQWEKIRITVDNSCFTKADRYYYSEVEPGVNDNGTDYDGNYWHYVDGVPTVWKKEN